MTIYIYIHTYFVYIDTYIFMYIYLFLGRLHLSTTICFSTIRSLWFSCAYSFNIINLVFVSVFLYIAFLVLLGFILIVDVHIVQVT